MVVAVSLFDMFSPNEVIGMGLFMSFFGLLTLWGARDRFAHLRTIAEWDKLDGGATSKIVYAHSIRRNAYASAVLGPLIILNGLVLIVSALWQ